MTRLLEFDVKGMFDNIPHELIMKALNHHTQEKWILIYCERWLKAGIQIADNISIPSLKGTPQGGVISPLLMNLFMHYAFDMWMVREFEACPWARYADDAVIHCKSKKQAQYLKDKLTARMQEVGLELHRDKTKIVSCVADKRKLDKDEVNEFDFLSFTFRPRGAKDKAGQLFMSFLPAMSSKALKRIRHHIKYEIKLKSKLSYSIEEIAELLNPKLRGWHQYYSKFYSSSIRKLWCFINDQLALWVSRKFEKSRGKKKRYEFLRRVCKTRPSLFVHWKAVKP